MRHVPNQILRVHDVCGTVDMLAVLDMLRSSTPVARTLVLPDELRHQGRS
jgi:hypothetical protein